jgi:hypothetical protein
MYKEKENLFLYFAYPTFFSTTVRIIDAEFALGILGRVEAVEEVYECVYSLCVCVCVCAPVSKRISQLLSFFPLLYYRLGFSRISAGSQNS